MPRSCSVLRFHCRARRDSPPSHDDHIVIHTCGHTQYMLAGMHAYIRTSHTYRHSYIHAFCVFSKFVECARAPAALKEFRGCCSEPEGLSQQLFGETGAPSQSMSIYNMSVNTAVEQLLKTDRAKSTWACNPRILRHCLGYQSCAWAPAFLRNPEHASITTWSRSRR